MFYEGWVNLLATPDEGLRPLFNSANLGLYGNYNYFNNSTVSHDLVNLVIKEHGVRVKRHSRID